MAAVAGAERVARAAICSRKEANLAEAVAALTAKGVQAMYGVCDVRRPPDGTEGMRRFEGKGGAGAKNPLRRIGASAEVADAMLFLASDAASYVTGAILVVDGGGWLAPPPRRLCSSLVPIECLLEGPQPTAGTAVS